MKCELLIFNKLFSVLVAELQLIGNSATRKWSAESSAADAQFTKTQVYITVIIFCVCSS